MRIPAELDARLVAEAERLDRSVSWLIVRALDGTIGGATQKVATQRAKAAENPAAKMTPKELDPYFDAIQEKLRPGPAVGGAEAKPHPAIRAEAAPAIAKGVKPMVYCTVCDRSSASTKWGCPDHGYAKVKPYKERGL